MAGKQWTFEALAQADQETLEDVLIASRRPDPKRLAGFVYNGYNHDWLGQLAGAKFQKLFYQRAGQYYGLNRVIIQDGRGWRGEWRPKRDNGQVVDHGHFRIVPATEMKLHGPQLAYRHLLCFDYNVGQNPGWNVAMRSIRDFVGAPNESDDSVLLGKAYLVPLPRLHLFATYFMLGTRQPDEASSPVALRA